MNVRVKAALAASASVCVLATAVHAADATTDAATSVQEVVVTAPRIEAVARERQKDAPTIVNVQSAETIEKYPDYNAAEALGRIPGISLSTDTGEGRFVNIRGIDANLNGATYGGVVLLNTFAAGTAASSSGRAVEFDTIPTGAIDGIVVYKTLSPDREAEGLGGQIELTPRSSKNLSRPFFEGELGWGYENLHGHTGPFTAGFAAGARFGFNNGKLAVEGAGQEVAAGSGWISNPTPFSIVITASRKDDRRGVDDTEPSYANDGSTCGFLPNGQCDHVLGRADFRYYDYHRRRFGYGGELAFKPNDDHNYYARIDVAGYKERAHKNHFYANFDGGNPSAPDANGFVTDAFQPQVDIVDLNETHRNTIATVGGQDRFDKLTIDYRAAYSRATYVENYYNEARFFGAQGSTGQYNDTANPEHFLFKLFQDAGLSQPFVSTDATQYGDPPFHRGRGNPALSRFYENDVDQEYSGAFNATYQVHLFGEDGQFKAGLGIRLRDKVVNDFQAFGGASANLSQFAPNIGANTDYYMGFFPKAPYADINKLNAFVVANDPVFSPSRGRDFKDQENVYAGYLMYTTNIGKLGILAGARIEATNATYGNFLQTTTPSGDVFNFVTHNKSYINVFPTVQFKYAVMPNLQVRATYSTGISRPGFSQAGGNAALDLTATPPTLTAGNPDLKPTTGANFDLDIEYYLPNGGIIQAGVFDKEFKNYIFRSAIVSHDPIFNGDTGRLVTFINEDAYARGVELAYHQKFTFLPGLLSGLGAEGNITWVDSRFKEYEANPDTGRPVQYSRLPGTSHVTWNLTGFYEAHGLALRLAAEYVGASLFALQGDRTLDTIQDKKLNLDFSSSYQFTRTLVGYFEVKNLLNTPLRYNDGIDRTRVQQLEYYGQTFEFGVRVKF